MGQMLKEFQAKRRQVRDLFQLEKQNKAASSRSKKVNTSQPTLPQAISQSTAKQFIPPKSFIWVGTCGLWAGHHPPYARVSARWEDWGEEGAMLRVVRMLWEQHIRIEALPPFEESCPFHHMIPALDDGWVPATLPIWLIIIFCCSSSGIALFTWPALANLD